MESVDSVWNSTADAYQEGSCQSSSPAPSSCSSGSCGSPAVTSATAIPGDTALPMQLVHAGWRRLWSHREKRHYYWNHRTNQSLWDLPTPKDHLSDPLGINQVTSAQYPSSVVPAANTCAAPIKRKSSEESLSHASHKRIIVQGPWDLEVATNVVVYERAPITDVLHAHPDIELLRSQLTAKLRSCYQEMCHSREAIDAPVGSFGRWLMERRLVDSGSDPLLPSLCSPSLSMAMYREIIADLPMRLVRPKFTGEARKQLSRYCEAAKKMIESSRVTSSESRKIVKWNVEDTFQWLRRTVGASFDDFDERLTHLRSQCQPHLMAASRASVQGICQKIYHLSAEYAAKIRKRHLLLLKEQGINDLPGPLKVDNARKVWCHAAPMLAPCPRLPTVEFLHDRECMLLRYRGETLRINTIYVQKLEHLYRSTCVEDRKLEMFLTRVWCMLRRYNTFWGGATPADTPATQSSQMSLPQALMECLNRHFGVTFELFASPLNCYFRQYCSPFVDTDGYFGSRGPACLFRPVHGSFVVHPPCCDQLQLAAIGHAESLLECSAEPLSFVFVMAESSQQQQQQSTPADGTGELQASPSRRLQASRWKRRQITLPAHEHSYRHGFQHAVSRNDASVKSWYSSLVVWLQNDAGHLRWTASQERVDAVLEAFRVDDGESDRTSSKPVQCEGAARPPCPPSGQQMSAVNVVSNGQSLVPCDAASQPLRA